MFYHACLDKENMMNKYSKGQTNLTKGDIAWLLSMSWCHVMLCHGRYLGFDRTGDSAIRSADPINPINRNMKWTGWPVAEIWPFEIRHITRGAFGPQFWGKGGRWGSSIERAVMVSCRLSTVAVALSLTIRPQFAIKCLQRLKEYNLRNDIRHAAAAIALLWCNSIQSVSHAEQQRVSDYHFQSTGGLLWVIISGYPLGADPTR